LEASPQSVESGRIKEMVGKKGRVRVEAGSKEDLSRLEEEGVVGWGEMLKGKVEGVRRLDQWAGMVMAGMEVERWDGKMQELRKRVEVENGVKLMKMPVWLAGRERIRSMGLKHVGVVIHVARESERMRMLEEGMKWDGGKMRMRKFVDKRELEFCTKCGVVGHSWWRCVKGRKVCSVCAVVGHTGWEHRCGKCGVNRAPCVHYRRCVMCKGEHTMNEASEGNCWGVRMEMRRLRSLDG